MPAMTDAMEPASDSRNDLARELEDRATEYERRADAGGDDTNTTEELRELATDARSQAQLYRDKDETDQNVRTHEAPTPEGQANRAEAGVVYDSAERRPATAQQMESAGITEADVRFRARVDAGHAQTAAEVVAQGAHAGTRSVRGPQARGPQRNDRSR